MKALAYRTPGAIDREDALIDVELEPPAPGPRDLQVEIRAVSVNPVDTKVRRPGAAAHLKAAHALIESGRSRGKLVLGGF